MNDFVTDYKDKLPSGWGDRLSQVGDSHLPAGNGNVAAH